MSWLWVFGDGNTSTLQNPSYNYAAPGVYSVNLTSKNSDNVWNTSPIQDITIYSAFIANINSPITTQVGYNPMTVVFNASASGGVPPYTYNWTFLRGNRTSGLYELEGYSSAAVVSYTFTEDINVNWTKVGANLTVLDSIGNSYGWNDIMPNGSHMYVVGKPYIASISTVPPLGGQAPLDVQLYYTYDTSLGGVPTFSMWRSNDGQVAYWNGGIIHYAAGGNKTITLDIANPSGNATYTFAYVVLAGFPASNVYWVDSSANAITEAFVGANTSVYFDTGDDGVKGHETLILDQFKVDIYRYDPITLARTGVPLYTYWIPPGLVRHTGYIGSTFTPTTEGSYYAELYAYNTTYGGIVYYHSSVLKVNQNPLTASNWGGWINGIGGQALGFIITMLLCAGLMTVPYLVTKSFNMYIELLMLIIGLGIGVITGLIWIVWAIIFAIIGVAVILLVNYEGSEVFGGGGQNGQLG